MFHSQVHFLQRVPLTASRSTAPVRSATQGPSVGSGVPPPGSLLPGDGAAAAAVVLVWEHHLGVRAPSGVPTAPGRTPWKDLSLSPPRRFGYGFWPGQLPVSVPSSGNWDWVRVRDWERVRAWARLTRYEASASVWCPRPAAVGGGGSHLSPQLPGSC